MIVLERLRDYIEDDTSVWAHCSGHCGHSAPLDIKALAERFGEEALLSDLMRKLRCSGCGAGAKITQSQSGGSMFSD